MADGILNVLDATGTELAMSTTLDAEGSRVGSVCVTDPGTGLKALVGNYHNLDAQTVPTGSVLGAAVALASNGTTLDRLHNNNDVQASLINIISQPASTNNSVDLTNFNGRGVVLGIYITALGSATTLTVTIQGKDAASAQYYNILASTALSSTGFTTLTVYPGATPASNSVVSLPLPRTWAVKAVIAGSNTCSVTLGASVLV